jgi:hypothetical protein
MNIHQKANAILLSDAKPLQRVHYEFKKNQKSKMGKIAHFSTNQKTCYKVCKYCYGVKIANMYKASKRNYDNNTQQIINRQGLPPLPKKADIVRISVNGDFSFNKLEDSFYYIQEWINLARKNPQVKFFGYTKSWQDSRLLPLLNKLRNLANVVLRASVDDKTGYNVPAGWVIAGILQDDTIKSLKGKRHYVCKFEKNKIQCSACKICFKSKLSQIAILFPSH